MARDGTTPGTTGRKRLGEMLIEAGVIDAAQLEAALGHQRKWGGKLGQALVELQLATEPQIVSALSKRFGYESVNLAALPATPQLAAALKLVARDMAARHALLPVASDAKSITIAMSDPSNVAAVDEVAFHTGRRVKIVLAGDRDVVAAVRRHYFPGEEPPPPILDAIPLDEEPERAAPQPPPVAAAPTSRATLPGLAPAAIDPGARVRAARVVASADAPPVLARDAGAGSVDGRRPGAVGARPPPVVPSARPPSATVRSPLPEAVRSPTLVGVRTPLVADAPRRPALPDAVRAPTLIGARAPLVADAVRGAALTDAPRPSAPYPSISIPPFPSGPPPASPTAPGEELDDAILATDLAPDELAATDAGADDVGAALADAVARLARGEDVRDLDARRIAVALARVLLKRGLVAEAELVEALRDASRTLS